MINLAFKYSIFLTLLITGVFLLFGVIYSFLERKNRTYLFSTFGNLGILFTGLIGTTIHEIGHLIMCFLFHHKVTDFQLFNFKGYKYEETLGYVSHRYNKNNLFEKCGNFFIGMGPMILGILFIILSFRLLMPDIYKSINISDYFHNLSSLNLENIIILSFEFSKNLLFYLFKFDNFTNINFYIFIYLIFCVSSHMSLSKKDFENSFAGILSLFFIIFIICLLTIFLNFNFSYLLLIFFKMIVISILFLSIGLLFSIFSLFISFTLYKIKHF